MRPNAFKKRQEWKPVAGKPAPDGQLELNEIGVWGGVGRGSVAGGIGFTGFPKTGEFRLRVQASATLPAGVTEMPLRFVMGEPLNVNGSYRRIGPVGTIRLKMGEKSAVYEFRGRMENFPFESTGLRRVILCRT